MKRSLSRYTAIAKRDKIAQNTRNLLVHIAQLSTAA